MSIVKSKIIDQLAKNYPTLLRKDLEISFDLVLNKIIKSLGEGKSVQLRKFGTFKIKEQKARIGRNPKNGTKVYVKPKKVIKWKMSKELFNDLNNKNNDLKNDE